MKALIAMSGGVDSSVAAFLTKKKASDCAGCIMRLYENDMIGEDLFGTCCSVADMSDAASVCERIGIPFHVYHYEHAFRECVIEPFVAAYLQGLTPNPCLNCNRYLKFAHLYERAAQEGFDTIVTGHYARVKQNANTGRYELLKGIDPNKDQSYVLYMLTQEQLSHTFFPLGELTKGQVRAIAAENGFVTAKKKESQDICFVPDGHYSDFIARYTGKQPAQGNFVDASGQVLGKHKGISHYTIGQRRGLGLSSEASYYVTGIRPATNEVVLGRAKDVFSKTLIAEDFNWVSAMPAMGEAVTGKARVRYRHEEAPMRAVRLDKDLVELTFDEPQRAITPGQAVVLYDEDRVLGGGTITLQSALSCVK